MPPETPLDDAEIAKFDAQAADWWNPYGMFKPLHRFNPVRLAHIRRHACRHFGRDDDTRTPFTGLKLLDIGCGGGLLCEPMARLGASVVGIDAGAANINVAAAHARRSNLDIDYRATTPDKLDETFDIILNMEVIEHTAAPEVFMQQCADRLATGGLMFLATLNRTRKSFLFAIVGAEYVLRWLPRGTHDWHRFVTPAEMTAYAEQAGLAMQSTTGVSYNPLSGAWVESGDLSVNYIATATKP